MKSQNINKILALLIITLFSTIYSFAQSNQGVDLTFNPSVLRNLPADSIMNFALQPNGKIIVWGPFGYINGLRKTKIARLNTDGSLDNTFECASCDSNFEINSVVVQPDGKILVAGSVSRFSSKMIRLNSDGSLDSSFIEILNQTGSGPYSFGANVFAVQADGKIYASKETYLQSSPSQTRLSRLNPDGSIDTSFTTLVFNTSQTDFLSKVFLLPDGKIIVTGAHPFGYVFRVNSDGTKDNTFESPLLAGSIIPFVLSYAYDFALQADGRVIFTGNFTQVNGISRTGFARLNADGSLDSQYVPPLSQSKIKILSSGKILVATDTTIVRLNTDGTVDNSYSPPANLTKVTNWVIDSTEKIIFWGVFLENSILVPKVVRLNTNGSLDSTFNTAIHTTGTVSALAQANGKVIAGGSFNRIGSINRNTIARINADETIDVSFDSGSGFNDSINVITVQSDNKILVGGKFTNYNGTDRAYIARLNSDGSLDASFNPEILNTFAPSINSIVLQSDGKILIGGGFDTVNGESRTAIARLNSDGSLDASFNPVLGNPIINSILLLSNGKMMIGGEFNGVNGFGRSNLARLNSDGSLDTTFNAGNTSTVYQIVLQPDGKFLLGLRFTLKRVNGDGSADNTFQLPTFTGPPPFGGWNLNTLYLQNDGSVVIGGSFTSVNGILRDNLARLSSTGTVDMLFVPGGANAEVFATLEQPNNKIIVGGSFSAIGNVDRAGIARITLASFHRVTNFDFDGDGLSDISVFRPSTNTWYIIQSSNFAVSQQTFGASGDIATPADFDGDGKTDLGIFRPSTGTWWYKSSTDGIFRATQWGANGDIPLPSDFNGDGKTDFVIYRPSQNMWYRLGNGTNAQSNISFGAGGDLPLTGDFDGDGKSDPAIFRPSTGDWWYQSSINNSQRAAHWGVSTDKVAPGDYDGDGRTDLAVYRPSTGVWYIQNSSNGSATILQFGVSEDKPVAADYDGDGRADIAVFRPSTGVWYVLRTTAGFWGVNWGVSTDVPIPNAFVP